VSRQNTTCLTSGIHLTLEDDILPNLSLGEDIHTAPTRLVCLENTLSGMILPQDEIVKIKAELVKHNIPLHCDGARIWNVAAAECAKRGIQGEEALQEV
jgi:threonine aldolase